MANNNNNNTNARIDHLSRTINELRTQMNQGFDDVFSLVKDLVDVLSPLFPRVDSYSSSEAIEQAASQAADTAFATPANPNLKGRRYIEKVPKEAKDNFTPTEKNRTPNRKIRLLAMLNILKKDIKKVTNLRYDDPENQADYSILNTLARRVHDDLVYALKKQEGETNGDGVFVLPAWSKVDRKLREQFCYILEGKADLMGFPIHYCEEAWGADLLLYGAHRNRHQYEQKKAQRPLSGAIDEGSIENAEAATYEDEEESERPVNSNNSFSLSSNDGSFSVISSRRAYEGDDILERQRARRRRLL